MSIVGDAADVRNYFDQDSILSKWGFADNVCYYCGVMNSDLNGLLMQCGKCKKAYYCGMKCFNADLPRHQQFCGTKALFCQPKKSDFTIPTPSTPLPVDADAYGDRPRKDEYEYMMQPKKDKSVHDNIKSPRTKEKKKKKKRIKDLAPLLGSDGLDSEEEYEVVSEDVKVETASVHNQTKKANEKTNSKYSETSMMDSSEPDSKTRKKKTKDKVTTSDDASEITIKSPRKKRDKSRLKPSNKDETESSSYEEWEECAIIVEKQVSVHQLKGSDDNETSILDEDSLTFNYENDSDNDNIQNCDDRRYKIHCGNKSIPDPIIHEKEDVNLRQVTRNAPRKSKSELQNVDLRPTPSRTTPSRSRSEIEKVCLNETEVQHREYEWEIPDWTKSQLRATEIGGYIKTQGDIKDSSLNSSIANIQGKYRTKPDWAQKSTLRRTGTGELIKQGVDVLLLRTPIRTGSKDNVINMVQGSFSHLELDGSSNKEIDYNHQRELLQNVIDSNQSNASIQWQKPDWTKENLLRNTGILKQLREGVDLRKVSKNKIDRSGNDEGFLLHMSSPNLGKTMRSGCMDNGSSSSYGLFHSSFSNGDYTNTTTTTAKKYFESSKETLDSPMKRNPANRGCRRNKSYDL